VSLLGEAAIVAGKDLRIELRSRVIAAQVLPFGAIILFLFAFALDPDSGTLKTVAPGLFWVAVLLSLLLAIGRSFQIEMQHSARDGLRLSGLDGAAIFLGKATAVFVELLALELILGAGVVLLYDVSPNNIPVLTLAAVAATVALASLGTLYGVIAAGLRVRETLLPLLLLPALTPVMLGATRSYEAAIDNRLHDAWPWIGLLALFAVITTTMGVLSFGALLEES
jgi:heme exporter protein B